MAADVGRIVKAAMEAATSDSKPSEKRSALSGGRGVAAGAVLAALAPLAGKGAAKLAPKAKEVVNPRELLDQAAEKVTKGPGQKLQETIGAKVDTGGLGSIAKEVGKSIVPGAGTGGDRKSGVPGVGKRRRMPVQEAVDVAAPIETAYNQWTQFEDWPLFMHRLQDVFQEDDRTVSFKTGMWGMSKEFTAHIVTQRPDERIKWNVAEGVTHTGVVTFHELAPRLTRIEVNIDVAPGSLIEKAARGMRHVKRAVRSDLHRFKAFIEMQELETGAWRGVIEDGEVVVPHPDEYDEERDYSDVDDIVEAEGQDGDLAEPEESEESDTDSQRARTRRFERQVRESAGGARHRPSAGGDRGTRTARGASPRPSSGAPPRGGSNAVRKPASRGSRTQGSSERPRKLSRDKRREPSGER
jgi:uncharacterized membrane protein